MTDILVDIPFVAENVPDPASLTNAQLIAVGQRVAQQAWAAARNVLAPPSPDEPSPFAFGNNVVAVVHRDPARGAANRWVHAVQPFSGNAQADAQKALEALAAVYDVNPANFTPQQRVDWGPFVFEAVRNLRP